MAKLIWSEHAVTDLAELVAYWQQEELCGYRTDISDSQTYARAIQK